MLALTLLALCASGALASSVRPARAKLIYAEEDASRHFDEFILKYNKQYAHEDQKQHRFEIFKANLKIINEKNMRPNEHATFGITAFTDFTTSEFLKMRTGLISQSFEEDKYNIYINKSSFDLNETLPKSFDWRDHNAVTKVKDQRRCGSCWAFSTIGSLEGAYAIETKNLTEFSVQQLIDCDNLDSGCNGGIMNYALASLSFMGGAMTEKDYPSLWEGTNDGCLIDPAKIKVSFKWRRRVRCHPNDEEAIVTRTLLKFGPPTVAIDAADIMHYTQGIIKNCYLNIGLNHGVLLVGYGEEDGEKFWTLKNSWSDDYGEKGYFRVSRGVNSCGMINAQMVMPFLKGPSGSE